MAFKPFGGNTVECRACHQLVSTDATECPHCGENLEGFKLLSGSTLECRACHETVSTDATECPYCGENLEGFKLLGGNTLECRACHEPVSTDATECPHCGENLEGFKLLGGNTLECRACHEPVSTDATECPHCGENLEGLKLLGGNTLECRACHEPVSTDAVECPHCGEDLDNSFFSSQAASNTSKTESEQHYHYERSERSQNNTDEETDSSGWLIKLIIYGALIVGAIWLAFAVVLPLAILNCALIGLALGLIYKENKTYLFLLSVAGAIFTVIDYNKGWFSRTLVTNVSFFTDIIPFLVYLNISAGLVAGYFLIRNFMNEKRPAQGEGEFSKRNLIIMGLLLAIGATTILLQNYFESRRTANWMRFDSSNDVIVTNANNGRIVDSSTMVDGATTSVNTDQQIVQTSTSNSDSLAMAMAINSAIYNSLASNVDEDSVSLKRLFNTYINIPIGKIDIGKSSIKAHYPYLLTITANDTYKFTNLGTTNPLLTFVSLSNPNIIMNEAQAIGPEDFVINMGSNPISPGKYVVVSDENADVAINDTVTLSNNIQNIYHGLYTQSSIRLLTPNDMSNLNKQDLKIMRNEIFARHGYIFKTVEMKNYFNQQNWYRPTYSDVTNQLSDIEKTNVELIKSYEK